MRASTPAPHGLMEIEFEVFESPDPDGAFDADDVWRSLDERSREVLRLRFGGRTLDEVGQAIGGVSRERARQIQATAESGFTDYLAIMRPGLQARLTAFVGDRCAVSDNDLAGVVVSTDATARSLALHALGLSGVRVGTTMLTGWWTTRPDVFRRRFADLVSQVPFLEGELAARAGELKLPEAVHVLLGDSGARLLLVSGLGWVRRSRVGRDTAYLWLTTQGEPRMAGDIAAVVGSREHAIRETMRRDPDFVQIRPEGTWALSQWNTHFPKASYTNATDVVVDVLQDRGPIGLEELFAEARRLYPVGAWRYNQTLSDSRVGRTPNGLYDLTERGAKTIEDVEPRRPENMAESDNGRILAVRLPVNHDLLRGSGIGVNRWLTWRLGLRVAPTARRFELLDPPGEVTVRRNSSSASVSSLRIPVQEVGLVEGCEVVLLLRPEGGTASLKHACATGSCPAELD